MKSGIRPYVTAGVALVGAGAIAVTPVNAAATQTQVSHQAVQLAAIPSPLVLYPQVFLRSVSNAGALLEQYFADPFPIISATLSNMGVAFSDAVAALAFGTFDEFYSAAVDFVVEPFRSAGAALSHLGAILAQPFAIEGFSIIAISPILSGFAATGKAIAEVFDAFTRLDLIGVVSAIINIPARIIDGVLNGVPGASFGIFEDLPGLLSPLGESGLPPGPIAVGINLDQDMGAAIPPRESTLGADVLPNQDASTFTLTTDLVPDADPEPEIPAAEDLGNDVIDADVIDNVVINDDVISDDADGLQEAVEDDDAGGQEMLDAGAETPENTADSDPTADSGPGVKVRGAADEGADRDAAGDQEAA